MKSLYIPSTEITPEVILDLSQSRFEIKGSCRPENAVTFYQPVINWLNEFNTEKQISQLPIQFMIDLEYLNSVSIKILFDILKKIELLSAASANEFTVIWHYNRGDIDMKEIGEEYSKIIKLKFLIQPIIK